MNVSLSDIESAIRRNFVLDSNPRLFLETQSTADRHDDGIARMVFVGCALSRGYTREQICHFLNMSDKEFIGKSMRFKDMLRAGIEKREKIKIMKIPMHEVIDKHDTDRNLHLVRKVMLVNNCLNLMLQAKSLEFRRSLPNYVG